MWCAPSTSTSSAATACATGRRRPSTAASCWSTPRARHVGQINGLSVLQLGSFAFGRPTRITARVRLGSGRVTDIEREAKLGGPLHSKGVMILWGFLAGRYALDVPLALAATLVFEQSYGGVDGDSASSAELYALLSALSDIPDQAVAGGDGLGQPMGRGAGHRRRQREDRRLLRHLPRPRIERAAGRADPQVQRPAPDAARGRGGRRAARPVRHLSGRQRRRGHRDPDRSEGWRARRRKGAFRPARSTASSRTSSDRLPSAGAASPDRPMGPRTGRTSS